LEQRRSEHRQRTLRSGKIIFNNRQSVIDCIVRNLSDSGTCLQVNTTAGLPKSFELVIDGESASRHCRVVWQSETRLGVECRDTAGRANATTAGDVAGAATLPPQADAGAQALRNELLTLRAALDEVPVGIVLLDADTRAQFINRAFRRMWRLPDSKADSRPPFVALMYHGRDTNAYAVASGDVDAYVAERVAHVKSGNPKPLDLRLANGEVIRMQCAVLPSGGRMLCYTTVTDIVRHSEDLEMLRGALDQMQPGIVLLDEFLNAQFMNRAVRELWKVSDEQAGRKPSYAELVNDSRTTRTFGVPEEKLDKFIKGRIAVIRAGDPTPIEIPHADGRTVLSQCAVLPGGGRMVTYTDVTGLVRRANEYRRLASHDGMTGVSNRRQFEAVAQAEWARFQRYHRPLSLLMMDIDHFKQINDRLGHEAGDKAIKQAAQLCTASTRTTDVVARFGGDEFVALLPETDLVQARVVAERLRSSICDRSKADGIAITVSIGIVAATAGMSDFAALMRLADKALYEAKAAGRDRVVCLGEPAPSHGGSLPNDTAAPAKPLIDTPPISP
jgi:diguanylate cyclase (GGDEF)-like protein